jgi:hypothetical protein
MKTMYLGSILRQFFYESEEWERLLAFVKQENIFYKSRLAEIVNTVDDEDIVIEAEKFNDDFLSQDRIIDFLIEEVKSHHKTLQKDLYLDAERLRDLFRHQKKLRTDIEKAEDIFLGTKKNFSGFLNTLL